MNSHYLRSHHLEEGGDVLLLAGDVAYLENRRLEKNPVFDRYSPSSVLSSAFHVDMASFIEEHDIDAWIYGHTYYNGGSGTIIPSRNPVGTELLSNQLGYVELDEERLQIQEELHIVGEGEKLSIPADIVVVVIFPTSFAGLDTEFWCWR